MSASPLSPNVIGGDRYITGTNVETGITATASGNQSNAYALTAQISRIDTVGSGNDSVALPKITVSADSVAYPGQVGMIMFVRNNAGANSMQVYGTTPDTINSVATGTGVAVAAGKSAIFWCDGYTQSTNVGTWQMVLSA